MIVSEKIVVLFYALYSVSLFSSITMHCIVMVVNY